VPRPRTAAAASGRARPPPDSGRAAHPTPRGATHPTPRTQSPPKAASGDAPPPLARGESGAPQPPLQPEGLGVEGLEGPPASWSEAQWGSLQKLRDEATVRLAQLTLQKVGLERKLGSQWDAYGLQLLEGGGGRPSAPPRDELGPIEEAIAEMRQLKQAIEPLLALAAPAPDEE